MDSRPRRRRLAVGRAAGSVPVPEAGPQGGSRVQAADGGERSPLRGGGALSRLLPRLHQQLRVRPPHGDGGLRGVGYHACAAAYHRPTAAPDRDSSTAIVTQRHRLRRIPSSVAL